jgi:hypothetical protein
VDVSEISGQKITGGGGANPAFISWILNILDINLNQRPIILSDLGRKVDMSSSLKEGGRRWPREKSLL